MRSDGTIQEDKRETLDPARANALLATLGREGQIAAGSPLPPFAHHIYFWDARPPQELGRDGHPKVGDGLVPDLGLPRRMWAGGHLRFLKPLRAGVETQKVSRLEKVERKTGRSGPLGFVTLVHAYWQADELCVEERQDLVYREDPSGTAQAVSDRKAPEAFDRRRAFSADTTMLFRYSALTFNGHRIHYDVEYARNVEGYAGLVVHGPLLAQALILMAEDEAGPLTEFRFRGVSPMAHTEEAFLCRAGQTMWVSAADGRLIMQAEFSSARSG